MRRVSFNITHELALIRQNDQQALRDGYALTAEAYEYGGRSLALDVPGLEYRSRSSS